MSDKLDFVDREGLRDAFKDVRKDNGADDWVLLGYENPKSNKIVMLGKGAGGVSGFIDQ
jgi:hypothetical protein